MKFNSIQTKTTSVIGLSVLIIIGLMASLVVVNVSGVLKQHVNEESERVVSDISSMFSLYINMQTGRVESLASEKQVVDAIETRNQQQLDRVTETFFNIRKTSKTITNIGLFDNDCILLAHGNVLPPLGTNFSHRDYCEGVKSSKLTYISEAYLSATTNESVFAVATSVLNGNKTSIGFIIVVNDISGIRDIIYNSLGNEFVIMLDRTNTAFLDSRKDTLLQKNAPYSPEVELIKEKLIQNTTEGVIEHTNEKGMEHLIYFKKIKEFTIILVRDKKEVETHITSIGSRIYLGASVAVLFILITAWMISHSITKPINKLTKSVNNIVSGNLDVKLEKNNIEEIEELTSALDKALASMKLAILRKGLSKDDIGLGKLIKEKTKIEEELKTSEAFVEEIIEHAGIPIIAFARNGELRIANNKFFETTGYSKKDVSTKEEFIKQAFPSKEAKETIMKAYSEFDKEHDVRNIVLPVMCKNGSTIVTVVNIDSIKDSTGTKTGEALFLRDLTEIFGLEKQIRYWTANGFIQADKTGKQRIGNHIEISKSKENSNNEEKLKKNKTKKRGNAHDKENKNRNKGI